METTLLIPADFEVINALVSKENITLSLLLTSPVGCCPICHTPSRHVHSHYQRIVRDLPISGKVVSLQVCSRKFFCEQENCPRKIFAQQCSNCLKPYSRRLERATEQVHSIGLSLGSRPGARICHLTGLPLSASTVLRILRRNSVRDVTTPTVLGVDDFAFRRGNTYGTILIDLEKRQPVDLLPDREGKTLENWLLTHPGVAIVSRDRSSVYATAIRNACPEAIQVADRWHLLKNLGENSVKVLDAHRSLINATARELLNPPDQTNENPVDATVALPATFPGQEENLKQPKEKRYLIYKQVKQLQNHGHSARAIARHLGISRNTVRRYLKQEAFVPKSHPRKSNLLEYEPYLRQRWLEGEQCGKSLLKDIKARGYNGSYTILAVFLAGYPKKSDELKLPPAENITSFSSRSLSRGFGQQENDWENKYRPILQKLIEKSPLLRQLRELNLEFKSMMDHKKGECLQDWCDRAKQLSCFKGFVLGIQQDFKAVQQAMLSVWSNGQTEGQVNRLKNIKRQMYGRASFDLPKIRVLARTG